MTQSPNGSSSDVAVAMAATVDGPAGSVQADSNGRVLVAASALQQVGRFTLLRQLGAGAMGAVYAAYDERLDRRVAIKLLHQAETAGTLQRQRVLREAQSLARIAHPNVVSIFEVGEVVTGQGPEQVFIAMEFIEGTTLSEWQHKKPWPEVLRMYLAAGRGLHAAHMAGLIHRDFKPDNVLVGKDSRPRVADFGLARLGAADVMSPADSTSSRAGGGLTAPLTVEGEIAGTPGYMSPEQLLGDKVDVRSDQFSFCAALYEGLYGHLPYAGVTLAELTANMLGGRIIPPPAGSPVPPEVHAGLLRGLSIEPTKRFSSMAELLSTLGLEEGHTAAGAREARQRLLRAVVGTLIPLNLLSQYLHRAELLSLERVLAVEASVLCMILLCGLKMRNTLLRNAFHRRIYLITVLYMLQKLSMEVAAIRYKVPFITFLATDLVGLAGISSMIAVLFLPSIWWLPIYLFGVSGLTVIYGKSVAWLGLTCYSVVGGAVALAWSAAAGSAQRELLEPPA